MNNFGKALTFQLFDRLEGEGILKQLYSTEVYKDAQEKFKKACETLCSNGEFDADSPEQNLVDSLRRLCDIEQQCVYRLGIQDGLKISSEQFLVEDVM